MAGWREQRREHQVSGSGTEGPRAPGCGRLQQLGKSRKRILPWSLQQEPSLPFSQRRPLARPTSRTAR